MIPEQWRETISDWARQNQYIDLVYVFGSRAKGNHSEKSDLDLGVVVRSTRSETAFGVWCSLADKWEAELQSRLPVEIDLEIGNEDIATEVVAPAIADHGILIFRRNQ